MSAIWRRSRVLAAIAVWLTSTVAYAAPATTPAQLIVDDNAKFFSPEKIKEAKAIIAESLGTGSRQVHVETCASLSADEMKQWTDASDKSAFWLEWAKSKAKANVDRGVVVLICVEPKWLEVMADNQMHDKGFDRAKEKELRVRMTEYLRKSTKLSGEEAQAERDAALISAAKYLKMELPTTVLTPLERHRKK
jgi:hypothetical protein